MMYLFFAQLRQFVWALVTFTIVVFVSPIGLAKAILAKFMGSESRDIFWTKQAYANVLATVDETLESFMPKAEKIEKELKQLSETQITKIGEEADVELYPEQVYEFYVGYKNGEVIGYAAGDAVPGKWGLIHYMVFILPDGEIENVRVLQYEEKRGKPVARNRFLKQFRGKSVESDIEIMRDIKGVTGASISSNGMTRGIRKMIHVFHEFYGAK